MFALLSLRTRGSLRETNSALRAESKPACRPHSLHTHLMSCQENTVGSSLYGTPVTVFVRLTILEM